LFIIFLLVLLKIASFSEEALLLLRGEVQGGTAGKESLPSFSKEALLLLRGEVQGGTAGKESLTSFSAEALLLLHVFFVVLLVEKYCSSCLLRFSCYYVFPLSPDYTNSAPSKDVSLKNG
jgi:hypothetical protein